MQVYFVGIAGAGVSALASVLKSRGVEVSGSDEAAFPPISTYLEAQGIAFARAFDAGNLPARVDAAVIGTTAKLSPESNPEIAELARRGVPRFTFAQYLADTTAQRENLVIAGSFGKSTMTAMVTHVLRAAHADPGYFIGAVPLDLPTTGHWGSDRLFVMEGDEYVVAQDDRRSKIDLYTPAHAIITSLVHDHVNMFATIEDYARPFARLIERLPEDGLLVMARAPSDPHRNAASLEADQSAQRLAALAQGRQARGGRTIWYGLGHGEGYQAHVQAIGELSVFDIVTPQGARHRFETELLGLHNIENLTGAVAFALEHGVRDIGALQRGVESFRGVARRLDRKTRCSHIPIYEGFGSSKEKARSAIDAVRLHFPTRRLIVVFEPHTFSWRNAQALPWYDEVFEGVDLTLLLPPPTHGAGAHDQLDQASIAARMTAAGVLVEPVTGADEVTARLQGLQGEAVVLLLSSGPLDGLPATLPGAFDQWYG